MALFTSFLSFRTDLCASKVKHKRKLAIDWAFFAEQKSFIFLYEKWNMNKNKEYYLVNTCCNLYFIPFPLWLYIKCIIHSIVSKKNFTRGIHFVPFFIVHLFLFLFKNREIKNHLHALLHLLCRIIINKREREREINTEMKYIMKQKYFWNF